MGSRTRGSGREEAEEGSGESRRGSLVGSGSGSLEDGGEGEASAVTARGEGWEARQLAREASGRCWASTVSRPARCFLLVSATWGPQSVTLTLTPNYTGGCRFK